MNALRLCKRIYLKPARIIDAVLVIPKNYGDVWIWNITFIFV